MRAVKKTISKKVNKESSNIVEEQLNSLRKLIPKAFVEGRLSIVKLQEMFGDFPDFGDGEYGLNWSGRELAFKQVQTPTTSTLVPDKKQSINFDKTENIFIEGENSEVLKLLNKSYYKKIKCIYIDPPYNTGKDFIYKDNFRDGVKSYLEQTGQSKEGITLTVNPETSGRFHSDWLSFMYVRLSLAWELLSDDGIMFVSIDDHEVHNLRKLMDDIFGEENFVTTMVWKSRSSLQYSEPIISSQTEFILVFVKNKDLWNEKTGFKTTKIIRDNDSHNYLNQDNDPKGDWTSSGLIRNDGRKKYTITTPSGVKHTESWLYSEKNMKKFNEENQLWYGKNGDAKPRKKSYFSEYDGKVSTSLLMDEFIHNESGTPKKIFEIGTTQSGTNEVKALLGQNSFDYPKPTSLIQYLIKLHPDKNAIVLDFFSGSGTTAHAVLKLNKEDGGNRKFIAIQIDEKSNNENNDKYSTISDICKDRIKKVIDQLNVKNLGFKIFKLSKSNYKIWNSVDEITQLKSQLELFETSLIDKYVKEDVIYECIIKEGYSLNSIIEKINLETNMLYKIKDGEQFFYICFDEIKSDFIKKSKINKNDILICLDTSLDDSQKSNLSEQCDLRTL